MLAFKYLRQTCSQGQQGFACTGLAQQRHEVAFGVHQQIQGEVLFAVACSDAPHAVFVVAEIPQGFQHGGAAAHFQYLSDQWNTSFAVYKLVHHHVFYSRAADAVEGASALLPAFNAFAVLFPEIGGQFHDA